MVVPMKKKKLNLGGKASIKSIYGCGETAVEYSKNNLNTNADGQFVVEAYGMPEKSDSYAWAKGFVNQFAGQSLSKLNDNEAWSKSFDAAVATADGITIPEKKASSDPIPPYSINNISEAIEKMKIDEFTENYKKSHGGKNPPADAYEKYMDSLKSQASISDEDVNNANGSNGTNSDICGCMNFTKNYLADANYFVNASESPSSNKDSNMDIDLGGFGIVGYDYSPWTDFFPELCVQDIITPYQVTIGYVMIWLSIKGMFSQYLKFCTIFKEIAPPEIVSSSIAYDNALNDMVDYIFDAMSKSNYAPENLKKNLEENFIRILGENEFQLFDHYNYLVKNYSWLKKIPFGVVAVAKDNGKYYYQSYDDNHKCTFNEGLKYPASEVLENNAIRMYPIISNDISDKPYFVWTGAIESGDKLIATGITNVKYSKKITWGIYVSQAFNMYMSPWIYSMQSFEDVSKVSKESTSEVYIIPSKESINKKIWSLEKTNEGLTPDCILFDDGKTPKENTMCLSGIHKDIEFTDKKIQTEHLDIELNPIGYNEIQLSGILSVQGGVPMRMETTTNDIVKKLNELAR